jgi:hypothetical protein
MQEAQAAAEAEAEVQALGRLGEGDESGILEHDLDDDIPDADEAGEWVDEALEDTSPAEDDYEVYDERDTLNMEGDMDGRDLDDDIPEAGSYQHTDTEVEDESSDLEPAPSVHPSLPGFVPGGTAGSVLTSSVFGSSPLPRDHRSRQMRRISERRQRLQGREN